MSLVPRLVPTAAPPEPAAERTGVQVLREQVIVKEQTQPRGWRFVPLRDENNLIVEIIATPIND